MQAPKARLQPVFQMRISCILLSKWVLWKKGSVSTFARVIQHGYKLRSHIQPQQRARGHAWHLESSLTRPYPVFKKKATLATAFLNTSCDSDVLRRIPQNNRESQFKFICHHCERTGVGIKAVHHHKNQMPLYNVMAEDDVWRDFRLNYMHVNEQQVQKRLFWSFSMTYHDTQATEQLSTLTF